MMVCHDCHCQFHRQFDSPKLSLVQYLRFMAAINFGFCVYARSNAGYLYVRNRHERHPRTSQTAT